MPKKLFYYCISYEIIISNKIKEDHGMDFLIIDETSLNIDQQKEKLEHYYKENKIPFSEIVIIKSKQLSEKEYYIRTHYS